MPRPRIACGMIGSRQGWIEAPYVDCPVDLAGAGAARSRARPAASSPSSRARAASTRAGMPDVMRGEETQIAGAVAADEERVLAVLPGTHSKWALVERGRLVAFATFMTGELYAVLLEHSILGRMADRTPSGAGARERRSRAASRAGSARRRIRARDLRRAHAGAHRRARAGRGRRLAVRRADRPRDTRSARVGAAAGGGDDATTSADRRRRDRRALCGALAQAGVDARARPRRTPPRAACFASRSAPASSD